MLPGNLFAMFSNFRNFSNTLDTVLDSPEVSLERVLDEDSLISGLNSRNSKVLAFFSIDRLLSLLDFVLVYPPEGSDTKRCFKYPFLATEIFCAESAPFYGRIFQSEEFLEKFLHYLDCEGNAIQTGYFSRIFLSLLSKEPKILLTKLKSFEKLVNFVHFKSIGEVIGKVLALEFSIDEKFLEQRIELIKSLVNEVQNNGVRAKNASQLLVEILLWQGEINAGPMIFEYFEGDEFLSKIFEGLENENFVQILKALITTALGGRMYKEMILRKLGVSLGKIEELLNIEGNESRNTLQEPYKVLGKMKLALIQVVFLALQVKNEEFSIKISESSVLHCIVKLFWFHEWNSFLHCQFFQISEIILIGPFANLKQIFLQETGFIKALIDRYNSNPRKKSYHPEIKPGYDGVLIKIANLIEKIKFVEPIKSILMDYQWSIFKSKTLEQVNYIANRDLGGYSVFPVNSESLLLPDVDNEEPDYGIQILSEDELYWRF